LPGFVGVAECIDLVAAVCGADERGATIEGLGKRFLSDEVLLEQAWVVGDLVSAQSGFLIDDELLDGKRDGDAVVAELDGSDGLVGLAAPTRRATTGTITTLRRM
jgi:hypothetical protein